MILKDCAEKKEPSFCLTPLSSWILSLSWKGAPGNYVVNEISAARH